MTKFESGWVEAFDHFHSIFILIKNLLDHVPLHAFHISCASSPGAIFLFTRFASILDNIYDHKFK